jgi:hypothetical protein
MKRLFKISSRISILIFFIGVIGFTDVNTTYAQSAAVQTACDGIAGNSLATATVTSVAGQTNIYQCDVVYPTTDGTPGVPATTYLDQDGNKTTLPNGATGGIGGVQTDAKGNVIAGSSCTVLSPGTWFERCLWIPLLSWLGSWFLTLGGAVLSFAGLLFDTVINVIIVGFGSTLQTLGLTGTNGAITTGWDAFRDLANILIIGMFVFIAISTILGSKEYGYKKLVARVLVIAVLLNFSLLFTKLIIDASNFTAYQFYSQIAGTGSTANPTSFDTAGAFLKPLGITSVWNDTSNFTNAVGQTTGSAMQGFLVGLVGGILLVGIAAILFYGTILIAARGVVLVVLMVTSAVAFATYLIPNFAGSRYGWKGWWEALINCAVFAPLLMLFLSLSLMIMRNAPIPKSGNNLGSILSNPAQLSVSGNLGWQIIMTYIFTLGLLYVSFKISSTFASSTSGMNLSIGALRAPFAFGGRAVGAFAGGMIADRFVSRPAATEQVAKSEAARRAKSELHQLDIGSADYNKKAAEVARLQRGGSRAGTRARNPTMITTVAAIGNRALQGIKTPKPANDNDAAKKKEGEKIVKEAAQIAAASTPDITPATAPATAPAAVPVPTNDTNNEVLRRSIDNLTTETAKAGAANASAIQSATRTIEKVTVPVNDGGAERATRNAEAAKQHDQSENRSRLNTETAKEENALAQITRDQIATRGTIDNRMDTARASQTRIRDMIMQTKPTDSSGSTVRNTALQPEVASNVAYLRPPTTSQGVVRVNSPEFHGDKAQKAAQFNSQSAMGTVGPSNNNPPFGGSGAAAQPPAYGINNDPNNAA